MTMAKTLSVQDSIREIETLIRARYPIIYIVSWEEGRVERRLAGIAKKRNKKLFTWSCTRGIVPYGTPAQSQKHRNAESKDPLVALEQVIDQNEPAIYVFKDFHPFMGKNNFPVIRKLREVAQHLKNSYKTVVLVSPVLEIAQDLEKDVTVVDFGLPTTADLGELLDRIVDEVKDNPKIRINLDSAGRERLLQAALGLTLKEAENVFAKTLVNDGKLDADDVSEILSEKQQIIRKSGLLEYYEASEQITDIGGLDALKEWLNKRGMAFSDDAREFGLPAPKGVLLLGVQGCGKSLCAKAVSGLWNLPLLRFDMGKMFGSLVGSSEENIRRAIQIAESVAPAILWVDEIDKAFAGSQSSASSDGGTTARVFGTFLTWLSEKTAPVFIIATANDISQLPPELLRKGRLDEIFFVDLPAAKEREQIFAIHLACRGRDPQKFQLAELAEHSDGFSGAEIEEAVVSALYDAFYSDSELDQSAMLKALAETVPLSRTMSEGLAHLRNWAEGRARNASVPREAQAEIERRKIEL